MSNAVVLAELVLAVIGLGFVATWWLASTKSIRPYSLVGWIGRLTVISAAGVAFIVWGDPLMQWIGVVSILLAVADLAHMWKAAGEFN